MYISMMAENILGFIIYLLVALLMMGIGISQLRSKNPVGFYSGEKPPAPEELKDVAAWNKKHGMMWLLYGLIILLSYGIGMAVGDSIWCIFPMCGGVILPVVVMIWYHHRLIRRYKRKSFSQKEG